MQRGLRRMFIALCTVLFAVAILPLARGRLGAGAPGTTLAASSEYRLCLPLVHGAHNPTPTSTPTTSPSDFAQRVIELTNEERIKRGLAPLETSPALMDAARGHSEDMACNDSLSHIGSDDSDPGERISRAGYDWWTYGENIAAGYPSPEDVVNGWMASPDHRTNILNPDYCDIGVGYAYNAKATFCHYWTQVMAVPH
ncbi:MAG: CAP domain-containing protein [Anaerolineales bacterium]